MAVTSLAAFTQAQKERSCAAEARVEALENSVEKLQDLFKGMVQDVEAINELVAKLEMK